MARAPGRSSPVALLASSLWTLAQLALLIGGHVLIATYIWLYFQGVDASATILTATGMPAWLQFMAMLAALALDLWSAWHSRRQHLSHHRR